MLERTASKSLKKVKRIIGRENTVLGETSEYHRNTQAHTGSHRAKKVQKVSMTLQEQVISGTATFGCIYILYIPLGERGNWPSTGGRLQT